VRNITNNVTNTQEIFFSLIVFGTEQHFGIELIKGSIAQKTYLLKSSNFIIQYAIVNNPNFNQNNEK